MTYTVLQTRGKLHGLSNKSDKKAAPQIGKVSTDHVIKYSSVWYINVNWADFLAIFKDG